MDQQQFVPLLNLGVTGLGNAHTGHRLVGVVHHAMRPAVLTGDQVLLLDEPVVEDLLDRIGLIDDQQVHVVLDLLQPAHVGFRRIGFGAGVVVDQRAEPFGPRMGSMRTTRGRRAWRR